MRPTRLLGLLHLLPESLWLHRILITLLIPVLSWAASANAFEATEVYRLRADSVVLIVATDGGSGGESMLGSGSVITAEGLVITNAHVVLNADRHKPFKTVRVYTKPAVVTGDLRRDLTNGHEASLLAYDKDLDLAVLKVPDLSDRGIIPLADPSDVLVGQEVVAIGHPEQGGLWSLTYGRISGQIADQAGVRGKDVFQTDTSVNRGNSGGPLLDGRGYMVGINTNIARRGSGDLAITGVNFALKSSVARTWLSGEGLKVAYGAALPAVTKETVPDASKDDFRESSDHALKDIPPDADVSDTDVKDAEMSGAGISEPSADITPKNSRGTPAQVSPLGESSTQAKPERAFSKPRKKLRTTSAMDSTKAPRSPGASSAEKSAETSSPAKPDSRDMRDPSRATSAKEFLQSDTILTPKRPYSERDVYAETEREMESLMQEMRGRFK